VHVIIAPLAVILAPVGPDVFSVAVAAVFGPVAGVVGMVGPGVRAGADFDA